MRQKARAAEQALERLTSERRNIEMSLGDASFPSRMHREEMIWLDRRLAAITDEMAAAEAEWLDAASELEAPGDDRSGA